MENSFETPPGPQIDSENILEKADIIETSSLSGSTVSTIVGFSDGHKAFFSPAASWSSLVPGKTMSSLEAVAFLIDKLLGFHLVPASANRLINKEDGHLDEMIFGAKPALYYKNWEDLVNPRELLKAAVLDYILDSRDRRKENFLIDENSRRLWLINNDYFMFFSPFGNSDIINAAVSKGLIDLPPDILESIGKFYSAVPSFINQTKEKETIEVLNRARERARIVLDKKTIGINT